jgi:hypothetical protein
LFFFYKLAAEVVFFWAKNLVHPSCGSFLGGHTNYIYPEESDEEERDWDFI